MISDLLNGTKTIKELADLKPKELHEKLQLPWQ